MKPGNGADHRTDHKREIEQKTSDPHCDESFKSTDSSFDGEGKTQRNILSAYSRTFVLVAVPFRPNNAAHFQDSVF